MKKKYKFLKMETGHFNELFYFNLAYTQNDNVLKS